jgi:hypothetical protein
MVDWAMMVQSVVPAGQTLGSKTMGRARNWFYRERKGSNSWGEVEYLPQEVRQRTQAECERLGIDWSLSGLE